MRLIRPLGSAAALLLAANLQAQPGPTTGGTVPPPTSPTTGGTATAPGSTAPARPPLLQFPTDPAATARAAAASGSTNFPTLLTQMNGVPAALSLTDTQVNQLNTVTQRIQSQFQPQYARVASMPASEQAAAQAALNAEYTNAWLNAARGFLNADQLTRYQQLQYQYGGFASLSDPVAQAALNLTPAQLNQLKQNLAWSTQQQAAIQQTALTNQAQALQMYNAYNTAAQTRMNQLLTPTQQQSWSQLTGAPFAFAPMFPAAGTGVAGGPAGVMGTGTPGSTPPTTGGPVTGVGAAPPITSPPSVRTPAPGTAGPTTGGPAAPGGPTTGGVAPAPAGPTTGGTVPGTAPAVPPGVPTTGTAPGTPGPTTGGPAGPAGPTTGGTVRPGGR